MDVLESNTPYFKHENGKYLQKIGSAQSFEEGRAFAVELCVCIHQTLVMSHPHGIICMKHKLTPVSEEEVDKKFLYREIPEITLNDLYIQLKDHVFVMYPNSKKIIFERVEECVPTLEEGAERLSKSVGLFGNMPPEQVEKCFNLDVPLGL